jgi:Raf kinase inhibitor-like YbhB/YbcL family protein
MKTLSLLVLLSGLFCCGVVQAGGFSLSSPDIAADGQLGNAQVLNGFGCSGSNRSPALEWYGAPANTRSFAVTVYDPDAPTGSGWWHWVVYNIPAGAHGLVAGAGDVSGKHLPAGAVQGRTDFGLPGFGGACPPAGDSAHRYVFTVHALDLAHLDLPANASAAMVGFALHGHQLGSARLMARYAR